MALVVGSISRDVEQRHEGVFEGPGGVVHHAGRALARLGATVRVVTRLGRGDMDLVRPLREEGVDIHVLPSRSTTTYRNDYRGPTDRHVLVAASDPIRLVDVPREWRCADLVHLGPLHPRDVDADVAGGTSGLVGLDLQGLLRRPGGKGSELAPHPELDRFLVGVRVVHASEEEMPVALGGEPLERFVLRLGIEELLVTRGARGALLLERGRRTEIPARPAEGSHRVGAGDVFLTSYLYLRVRGWSPARAANGAVEVSRTHVEKGEVPEGLTLGESDD